MTIAAGVEPNQRTVVWSVNEEYPVGKGATVQEFVAVVGDSRYVIDVAPWGEGRLTVDSREIARVEGTKDAQQAFDNLCVLTERHLQGEPVQVDTPKRSPLTPAAKAKLLAGKRGLIVGIPNENPIAWGCARALGADLAVTYLNKKAKIRPAASRSS